jgi:predicted XRE-type DNA-binding protein
MGKRIKRLKTAELIASMRPLKEAVALQLSQAMEKKKISKAQLAELLKTSRSQVDRLLDPTSDVTLSSLQRAAAQAGRRVVVQLI